MLDPDYLPDYLSVSYDYASTYMKAIKLVVKIVSENTWFLKNKFKKKQKNKKLSGLPNCIKILPKQNL